MAPRDNSWNPVVNGLNTLCCEMTVAFTSTKYCYFSHFSEVILYFSTIIQSFPSL